MRSRLIQANLILLCALLGSHWGRRIDNATITDKNVLTQVSLPFRDWRSADFPLEKADAAQLEPDASMIRRYVSRDNQVAELTVIMGHRKRTVHTPTLCMSGGGWEVVSQRYLDLNISDRKVHAVRQVMTREGRRILLTYFFTDGDYCSPSLAQFQTIQLMKRLKADVPLGALVRTIVSADNTMEEADKISDDFAVATVPSLLGTIRNTHLAVN